MLYQYLEEAVQTKECVKIINANNKRCLEAEVINYDNVLVYLRYKTSDKKGSIKIENIQEISFLNPTKEKEFIANNGYKVNEIDNYLNYYKRCLQKLCQDDESNIRIELFEKMFHRLKKNPNNLLYKYLIGDIASLTESVTLSPVLLLQKSNISQRCAIENSIKYKVSVTEGPPGTGKTTTILSMIANFIYSGKQVVVVSKNNTAVDNIITEFKKTNLPEFYIRFGRRQIMDELNPAIDDKIQSLQEQLLDLNISEDYYKMMKNIREKLNEIEKQMNDLMKLKSILRELQNQARFIKRRNQIYDVESLLNEQQRRIINNKNATFETIDNLVKLSQKYKYTFFEKLLLKFRYHLNWDTLPQSIASIKCLLEEIYINKEIVKKENLLMKARLDDCQQELSFLYDEYNKVSNLIFKDSIKKFVLKGISCLNSNINMISKAKNVFPLILTTADAFLYNFSDYIEDGRKIDCLIIDEATQCDVLTGLPLLFLAKKIVVVGDSKQLSAITDIKELIENDIPEYYIYENNNFLKSIKYVFNPTTQILLEHYRCDYNIINFCNKYYYDNQLIIYTQNNHNSMNIIDVDSYKGAEQRDKSILNEREIKTIRERTADSENCFFITPFRMQANEFKKYYDDDICGTIHAFQGKGTDNVYFSTVLNDLPFCLKHIRGDQNLFTKELLNVAVSRAKRNFTLVCDKKFLVANRNLVPDVAHLIEYIQVYGNEIEDKSICIFDDLYKKMNSYTRHDDFDNVYEEKLFFDIKKVLEKHSHFTCYKKLMLIDLVQNRIFLDSNPEIKNYIANGAHADFTIIDQRINKPILVIELDGKYHQDKVQKRRDGYKKRALDSMDIPLLRIPSKSAISFDELNDMILKYIY